MHNPTYDPLLALAAIGAIGALAQWLAWRFKQPSILVLLFAGILAGPILGWVEPGRLFGESLFPTVSLAVALLIVLIHRDQIPERLHNLSVIGVLVSVFAVSNAIQAESGLLTATVLGMLLANQSWIDVGRVLEFKENLRLLVISALFIVLSARLDLADLAAVSVPGIIFVAVLIFVARPLAVLASTLGSALSWPERFFAAWMAPRGIVAAAVSSVFAIEMAARGYPDADRLVSIAFLVIIITVAVYGLTAAPMARLLAVADQDPQGVLLLGAHPWARDIAKLLQEHGITVRLVDGNRSNTRAARMAGLDAVHMNFLADNAFDEIDLAGMGRFLAVTPNDEVISMAALHAAEIFERDEIFQLAPVDPDRGTSDLVSRALRGRVHFDRSLGFTAIKRLLEDGL